MVLKSRRPTANAKTVVAECQAESLLDHAGSLVRPEPKGSKRKETVLQSRAAGTVSRLENA
ncbi:hypothetical protein CH92_20710 [Stutzerimonas stutzeri]|uniref:Uncharacterized protein n=1 Tax=Stutzerimonas stutzeri TaxID=316 RepID=W8RD64_STUST|nr:hypothetical protein [Stutzerimonas stutzeri]AHL77698.1 hypothetical protein CH92_20710 [Stutzerimonas stutzeri]MCQ4330264.1 hypothetical protein [Stutzerimonas stutzeri]